MSDAAAMASRTARQLRLQSPEQTRSLGAALGAAVRGASIDSAVVIALNGELGAGKTTFVSGFLRAMGVEGAVRSPTYTLIEPYERVGASNPDAPVKSVYHMDLYRLANAGELEMLAPRDLLEPGCVLLVEWAERAGSALPPADLTLTLAYPPAESRLGSETRRIISVESGSLIGEGLAASLQQPPDEDGLSP
jgi:tRNA threonylcarbamoyladenosine biosynthesis protein TsaE